jgi:hypothetical protein
LEVVQSKKQGREGYVHGSKARDQISPKSLGARVVVVFALFWNMRRWRRNK